VVCTNSNCTCGSVGTTCVTPCTGT
jgi:hypothetical protein